MVEIIPAIMPQTFADLEDKVRSVLGFVHGAQIDVMDGVFVPSKSWPYTDETFSFSKRVDFVLPERGSLQYEVDLMVQEPWQTIDFWVRAGVSRVIFHMESVARPGMLVQEFQSMYGSGAMRGATELGVAIDVATSNDVLEAFLFDTDFVQFMGIARIGYQGEPFDERVVEKVKALREKHPEIIISVDGGVNLETAPKLVAAGATRLAVGSGIFASGDISGTIKKFQALHG